MMNKEEFEKYFKFHNKIVLFTKDNIPIIITKAYHLHLSGGHVDMDIGIVKTLQIFVSCVDFIKNHREFSKQSPR